MPPADRFGVFERDYLADGSVVQEEAAEEGVVRAVAEHVADGEDLPLLLPGLPVRCRAGAGRRVGRLPDGQLQI